MSKVEKAASLLLDTLLLILFCVAFAFRRMEEHYEKIAIDMITKRSSDEYVDLNGIMAFITISNSVDGSLVILLMVRMVGYVSLAPALSVIWESVDHASKAFASYFFAIMVIFIAFVTWLFHFWKLR